MNALASALAGLIGEDRLTSASEMEAWAVAGEVPEAVVAPKDAGEVAELLRWAGADGVGVVPRGGGFYLDGRRPRSPFVVLSTAGLRGIETYEPADLTLTARAGTTLARVNEALAEHRQWCPFDPPGGAGRTLGGVVASGHAGPLSAGYGAPRDHLLGATVVTGDGRTLELGGRVVKNVAGFDLLRLMVGSRGRLGVVVSACVRVFPVPAAERALVRRAERVTDLLEVAMALTTAPVVPAAAVLRADGEGPGLVVLLQGARAQVEAEHARLEEHASTDFDVLEGDAARATLFAGSEAVDRAPVSVRLSALPASLPELVSAAAVHLDGGAALSADVMAGTLRIGLGVAPAEHGAPGLGAGAAGSNAAEVVEGLQSAVESLGGTLAVEAAGSPLDPGAAAGSPSPAGVAELEAGLRRAFDPGGVLWPLAADP